MNRSVEPGRERRRRHGAAATGPHERRRSSLEARGGIERDWPAALADLAWLLATTSEDTLRDPAQAVRLAERAVILTGRADPALDVLAAAYASAGDFDRAKEVAQSALNLNPENAKQIAARRDVYRSRLPYRVR